jgi:hypothetical protein
VIVRGVVMTESKIIQFGQEYKWNHKKISLENWKEMKEYYAKQGRDIGDFPVMTAEEEAEKTKLLENIK